VLAVLERHAGLTFGQQDVYVSVAGGVRISEPAADLPLALALASARRDIALPSGLDSACTSSPRRRDAMRRCPASTCARWRPCRRRSPCSEA